MKRCPDCKIDRPETDFTKDRKTKDGLTVYCKFCNRRRCSDYRSRNPEEFKRSKRKNHLKQYGLTPEQYDEMLANQRGVCSICGSRGGSKGLVVDHDHTTGDVRGLLCSNCNSALGLFRDDVLTLEMAAAYLRSRN